MYQILMTLDDNYAEAAVALLKSLRKENPKIWHDLGFVFVLVGTAAKAEYLIKGEIGERDRDVYLRFNEIEESLGVSALDHMKRVSAAGLARIYLTKFISSEQNRILYLDCDIVCTGPIDELLSMDLGDSTLAAVQDARARVFADDDGLPGYEHYDGFDKDDPYFNSGVLLIDVARWRRDEMETRCLSYLRANKENLRYCDQDALNVAAHSRWKPLDPEWNFMAYWELPESRLSETRLVHFIDVEKPWHPNFKHEHFKAFYE